MNEFGVPFSYPNTFYISRFHWVADFLTEFILNKLGNYYHTVSWHGRSLKNIKIILKQIHLGAEIVK